MIYPPGYDPTLPYQELEYNGRTVTCITGELALRTLLAHPTMKALAACKPLSEAEWFALLSPAEPMTNT